MSVEARSSQELLQLDNTRDVFFDTEADGYISDGSTDIFVLDLPEENFSGTSDAIPMEVDFYCPGPSTRSTEFIRITSNSPSTDRFDPNEPKQKMPRLETHEEQRLNKALEQLRKDTENGIKNFGHYMQLKKDKLRYQVNVVSRVNKVISKIFEGVSIFVNGHTDPSALELRHLIQTHGGDYHCYLEYGVTTYIVASSLAMAKVDKTRKNDVFILPMWIVDCIAAGKRLPVDNYRLMPDEPDKHKQITSFFNLNSKENIIKETEKALDARDPNFIKEFYARSRLHLISTLAQEMKDFVSSLRETGQSNSDEWDKINLSQDFNIVLEPIIFHIDLDCFFVSVVLKERPDLQGKPVAITHSRGFASSAGFSEVASVSYAARKLGLKNGMLVRDALKLCPNLICLPYQFDEYRTVSKTIYTLVSKFSLEIRAVSCDEMYINFTKACTDRNITNIIGLANHIRARIREETGCPASVGIGPNILLSRLSTRKAKPDGVFWTKKNEATSFVAEEKIENIPGIGYTTMQKLLAHFGEMETCGELQNIELTELENVFGKKIGHHIFQHCRGEDNSLREFLISNERRSVSCDINYGIRFTQREEAIIFLQRIAEEVCSKLNNCRRAAGSVTLKLMVRSTDAPIETAKYLGHGRCDTFTKTSLIKGNTDNSERLFKEILSLFDVISPAIGDLRGVGVHCGRLVPVDNGLRKLHIRKDFFDPKKKTELQEKQTNEDDLSDSIVPNVQEMPKLNGIDTIVATKLEMKAILLEEPAEANVRLIASFLYNLSNYGAFSTLRLYCLHLASLLNSPDISNSWYEPLMVIFNQLDCSFAHQFHSRWIENELRTNPLVNNHIYCICPKPFECCCKL